MPKQSRRGHPGQYDPLYAQQAEKLCRLGATDMDLADFFAVDVRTIYRWKLTQPKFSQAVKISKEEADNRVERSLYHKATGYSFESEKVFCHEGEIIRAKTMEHVPPSDTSMIFWLKNRRPNEWRDRIETINDTRVFVAELPPVIQDADEWLRLSKPKNLKRLPSG